MKKKITSWDDLRSLPMTEFQYGTPEDASNKLNGKLYEEPLLVQSNARILIGHSTNGMLRFAAFPSEIYPVPIGHREIGFGMGMYYHTDNTVYTGNCYYSLICDGKTINLSDCARSAETRYGLHFLPITKTTEGKLEITLSSCAPVAEKGVEAFRGAPLPGPAGLLYSITLKNTSSAETVKGLLRLSASGTLIGDYEDLDPEIGKINKPEVSVRRNTLIVSRPEGSAGVYLQGGKLVSGIGSGYYFEVSYEIPPGESRTFSTYIVMAMNYGGIMEELYLLMRREPLDWISSTVEFWNGRLPSIEVAAPDGAELVSRLHEFFIRSLLDNFNCIQTDKGGNVITHRQGAPSHGFGTVWGIDYEPTIVSVSFICPELAELAVKFLLTRTRPESSYCKPNHSVPILCAPVVITAALLRQTGDTGIFTRIPELLDFLTETMEEILLYRHHDETLFETYWSSDGLTGRRYDYGTNVKLFYAFKGLAYIFKALGKDGSKYEKTAELILVSIEKTMLTDGPFGVMLSGGTNLDSDDEGMFIPDNKSPYYDGEDTSTILAPLYGACEDDYPPLVNYQRFGRSLFCENYQAETDLRAWFATPPVANDGTAVLASLGGSVSRNEMIDTGYTAVRYIDPVTGSLWWWPSGWKECRKLTRCSQGQGAWAWQYKSRWLGIETDALSRILTINPKGLPAKIHVHPSKAFGLPFEIEYDETLNECKIRNTGGEAWNVNVAFRKPGSGAEGERNVKSDTVYPDSILVLKGQTEKLDGVKNDTFSLKNVVDRETTVFGNGGILFIRRGGLWHQLQDPKSPIDLCFVIGNGTDSGWQDVKVTLRLPVGCYASKREQGALTISNAATEKYADECICGVGTLAKGTRKTASFGFYMPCLRSMVRLPYTKPRHLLKDPFTNDALAACEEISVPDTVKLTAVLEAITSEGKPVKRVLEFQAGYMPA